MRTHLDCIPCLFKNALQSARLAGVSTRKQKEVLDRLGVLLPSLPAGESPPETARIVHDLIRDVTKKKDIYKTIKKKSNTYILGLYEALKKRVSRANDRLLEAVELAIAGNVIDYGVHSAALIEKQLTMLLKEEKKMIREADSKLFDYKAFVRALKKAQTILYLADNAGETVFDRLLIEHMHAFDKKERTVLYAVKEKPAINDALIEDAYVSKIDEVAKIISSGCDAPGTVLKRCSSSFMKVYNNADMIISKGQGNFEALSDEKRAIFFLLMVKCPVIADHVSQKVARCRVGDTILIAQK